MNQKELEMAMRLVFPYALVLGVLLPYGVQSVFMVRITSDTKQRFCAVSASGQAIPPMQIFAGQRFQFSPMNNCIPSAYIHWSIP